MIELISELQREAEEELKSKEKISDFLQYLIDEKVFTMTELCKIFCIKRETAVARVRRGKSLYDALVINPLPDNIKLERMIKASGWRGQSICK